MYIIISHLMHRRGSSSSSISSGRRWSRRTVCNCIRGGSISGLFPFWSNYLHDRAALDRSPLIGSVAPLPSSLLPVWAEPLVHCCKIGGKKWPTWTESTESQLSQTTTTSIKVTANSVNYCLRQAAGKHDLCGRTFFIAGNHYLIYCPSDRQFKLLSFI